MDWGALIGPAVVAAGVSGFISVVGLVVSTRTARAIHTEKLAFDRDQAAQKLAFDERLAERKFEFDKELAERKFQYDHDLHDHKRRVELAEEVLSSFYQMVDIIKAIRSPFGYAGEGKSRPIVADETPEVAQQRDTYYSLVERFEARRKEMADLLSRRYHMIAVFGKEVGEAFDFLNNALSQIIVSARRLGDWAGKNWQSSTPEDTRLWKEMRGHIWDGENASDEVSQQVARAVSLIEKVCRPVLQERVK